MSNKPFPKVLIVLVVIMALVAVPSHARAGGVCGGTFVVERGETLESIASTCGTTVSVILAANPGISGSLTVGQVITVPGSNYLAPSTPVPTTVTPGSSTGNSTYTVKAGDTFSGIARQFGISVSALWAANPNIRDINLLYTGQILNIPSSGIIIQPVATEELIARSWGVAPRGTATSNVRLSNKSKAQAYISLQGTTSDGTEVIREYPVERSFTAKVPAGWYVYVVWVGGKKMVGQFNLPGDTSISLTIYKDRIDVSSG